MRLDLCIALKCAHLGSRETAGNHYEQLCVSASSYSDLFRKVVERFGIIKPSFKFEDETGRLRELGNEDQWLSLAQIESGNKCAVRLLISDCGSTEYIFVPSRFRQLLSKRAISNVVIPALNLTDSTLLELQMLDDPVVEATSLCVPGAICCLNTACRLSCIRHPNLLPYYGVQPIVAIESASGATVSMESQDVVKKKESEPQQQWLLRAVAMDSQSLSAVLQTSGKLGEETAASYTRGILQGMLELLRLRVCHRLFTTEDVYIVRGEVMLHPLPPSPPIVGPIPDGGTRGLICTVFPCGCWDQYQAITPEGMVACEHSCCAEAICMCCSRTKEEDYRGVLAFLRHCSVRVSAYTLGCLLLEMLTGTPCSMVPSPLACVDTKCRSPHCETQSSIVCTECANNAVAGLKRLEYRTGAGNDCCRCTLTLNTRWKPQIHSNLPSEVISFLQACFKVSADVPSQPENLSPEAPLESMLKPFQELLCHPFIQRGADKVVPLQSTLRFPRHFRVDWLQPPSAGAEFPPSFPKHEAFTQDKDEVPALQGDINPFSRTASELKRLHMELKEESKREVQNEVKHAMESIEKEKKELKEQLQEQRSQLENMWNALKKA